MIDLNVTFVLVSTTHKEYLIHTRVVWTSVKSKVHSRRVFLVHWGYVLPKWTKGTDTPLCIHWSTSSYKVGVISTPPNYTPEGYMGTFVDTLLSSRTL